MGPSGKREELEAWILATAPRALAYAASLVRNHARAEDIVQDCYCRLLQKASRYDLVGSGVKLLFRTITRACINARTREREFWSLEGAGGRENGQGWEPADSKALEPDRFLMHQELQQAVREGLARLPVLHRAALELRSQGYSQRDIAHMLDITANHAGVLVHRARQALAAYLAPFLREATA